jgi:eukaryotic-like serine/threonine-protein kinase
VTPLDVSRIPAAEARAVGARSPLPRPRRSHLEAPVTPPFGTRRRQCSGSSGRRSLPVGTTHRRGRDGDHLRARDERFKRDVAVKLIAESLADLPFAVRRFQREAELGARLEHPNVVAILDAGNEPQEFIVMELVDGIDGGRLMQRHGRLEPAQALHVTAQVCQALEHAHELSVFHNDVSPRNTMIGQPDATAKLIDFGLASDAHDFPNTRPRDRPGTPGYMAPELLRGCRPSPQSDLYALGVVAHRFLAGSAPRRARATDDTAALVTAAPRLRPLAELRPGLPRRLAEAVDQAFAIDPDARPQSVAEFRARLSGNQRRPRSSSAAPPKAEQGLPMTTRATALLLVAVASHHAITAHI